MNRILGTLLLLAASATVAAQAWAGPKTELDQGILAIQHQWAHINYAMPEDQRAQAFHKLEGQADALIARYPGHVEPRVWKAITLSSHAAVAGPFSALKLAEQARDLLLEAEKKDPSALDGSIFTSLATLYSQVPGWPIGFGNNDKARAYFAKAIAANPDGIDPNYFYAQFLYGQHEYKLALEHVQKALAAPARPERPLADKGRRQEADALLAKVRADMGDSGYDSQVMR